MRAGLRRSAPLVLLLLAGCSLFRAAPVAPEDDTPEHRACREEARTGPAARALDRQRNPSNDFNTTRLDQEQRLVEIRAYRDCLRRHGLTLPGGVEPLRSR
jgi:hypothetical protein